MLLKQNDMPTFVKKQILPLLKDYSILTFTGPLGAGKTTLIREILHQSGVADHVTSPTFGYVKSYVGTHGHCFYHFDLYRIDSVDSFINAGFDEYLMQKNCTCLIEWPEVIEPLLETSQIKENVVNVALNYDLVDLSSREITILSM